MMRPVREYTFASDILGNRRSVWLEAWGETDETRPLIVFFDGEFYRSATHIDARGTLSRLVEGGELPPLAAAFVSYLDVQTRQHECPVHPGVPDAVAGELLPQIRDAFDVPVAADGAGTVLAGVSYTGLLVARVVLERPDAADRLLCQSPSFWSRDDALVEAIRARRPRPKHWWIDVGDEETDTDVEHHPGGFQRTSQIDAIRAVESELESLGHLLDGETFSGGHVFEGWRGTLPRALGTLLAGRETALSGR